jgi:hypothetical protein
MAVDFGDETGEKIFDWMVEVARDAGTKAALAAGHKLADAFKNARAGIGEGEAIANTDRWAKLDMQEFKEIPEYASIQEIIDTQLSKANIQHSFAEVDGGTYLLFNVDDAPAVANVFKDLEEHAQEVSERASSELEHELSKEHEQTHTEEHVNDKAKDARDASAEPLKERAARAREAAEALNKHEGRAHERTREMDMNREVTR